MDSSFPHSLCLIRREVRLCKRMPAVPGHGDMSKVALEIDAEASSNKLADFAMTFGHEFNEWYGTAISWVELGTT
jgi:hypothetical protein